MVNPSVSPADVEGATAESGGSLLIRALRWILRGAFLFCIAASVLAYGSVTPMWQAASTFGFAVVAGLAMLLPQRTSSVRIVAATALGSFAILGGWAVVQSLPMSPSWPPVMRALAHPAWHDLASLLAPDAAPSISVAPRVTLESILNLAAPHFAFVAAVALFDDDRSAVRLWTMLAALGSAIAAFGILQFLLDPRSILLMAKTHYVDSVTGSFINRNTAATFFGVTMLLLVGCGLDAAAGRGGTLAALLSVRRRRESTVQSSAPLWFAAAGFAVALLALMMTRSRGGVLAAAIAFVVLPLVLPRADAENDGRRWRRVGLSVLAVFAVLALAGDLVVYRGLQVGLQDGRLCLYEGLGAGLQRFWLAGTGFGAFYEAFPPWRPLGCGGAQAFDRGHSVVLEGAYGVGVPVMAAVLLWLALGIAGIVAKGFRNRRSYRFGPAVLLSMLILVAAHSLVDFSLQINGFSVFFAAAAAGGATLCFRRPTSPFDHDGEGRLVVVGPLFRLGVIAAATAVAQLAATAFIADARATRLESLAIQIEMGRPPDAPAVAAALGGDVLVRLASGCRIEAIRAAASVAFSAVDQAADRITAAAVADFVERSLVCSPGDGNLWLRLAILRAIKGVPQAEIVPLVDMSRRQAPFEYQVALARVLFAAGLDAGGAGTTVRPTLVADLRYLALAATPAAIADLLDRLPSEAAATLLRETAGLPADRQLNILNERAAIAKRR